MELKEGYKLTDVGIIPIDWEVKKLINLSTLITKGTTPKTFAKAGINYIKIESLLGDKINIEKCLFVDEDINNGELKRSILNDGDLLFAIAGATIGKCAIVNTDIIPANTNQALAIIRLRENENKMFIFHFLKSTLMQKYIIDNIAGGAQPNMNLKQIGNFSLPIPPSVSEQKAIAKALSDTDALISTLDALIDKKRLIKQATMQQLLTGKRRLEGFSDEWEVKTLSEIGEFKNGINKGKEDFGYGYPFVNLMDVFGVNDLSNPSVFGLINSTEIDKKVYNLKKGDVLFIRSSVKPDGVGLTAVIKNDLKDTVYSGFLIRFRSNETLDLNFKRYCFNEEGFRNKIIINSTVSANTNINQDSLKNIEIKVPPSVSEQKAIAEILSDMDNEIAMLEVKRDKFKTVKQGMMQELLTGKTRLI
jgi:type I restriction enzyme, S subunit